MTVAPGFSGGSMGYGPSLEEYERVQREAAMRPGGITYVGPTADQVAMKKRLPEPDFKPNTIERVPSLWSRLWKRRRARE